MAALLILVVLLVGCPIGLYLVGGSPVPTTLPDWTWLTTTLTRPDTDGSLFLAVVRLAGWVAWGLFTLCTGTEAIGALAGRSTPSLPRPAQPMQLLARDLIALASLTITTTTAFAGPGASTPAAHAATSTAATTGTQHESVTGTATASITDRQPTRATQTARTPDQRPHENWRTRIIKRGDTLWGLARRYYGTGTLYPKIYKASQTIRQPNGLPPLTSPDLIHPGQHLHIPHPEDDGDRPPAAPPPRTAPTRPHTRKPAHTAQQPSMPSPQPVDRPPSAAHEATPPHSQPPTTSPPTEHAKRPTASTTPPASDAEDHTPSAITLTTGSRIGFGLAAALSVALAATRLHRRRRHQHSTNLDVPDAPEPAPAAPVVHTHKAHLDAYSNNDRPVPSDSELVTRDRDTPPPDRLTLGTRDRQPVTLPIAGLNLGLTGDGATSAARALVTDLLANARHDRGEVVLTRTAAQQLYPAITDHAAEVPGLTIVPTVNTAIAHLEAELVRRARLMDNTDQPSLDALRAADPAEPLPTILLAATTTEPTSGTHHHDALHAVLHLGRRHGIGGLLLGPAPHGTTLQLAPDGSVTSAHGNHADHLARTRLFHLTTDDATGMLHTLHTATGAPEKTNPPAGTLQPVQQYDGDLKGAPVPQPRPTGQDQHTPVRLQLLGPVTVHTAEGPITTGLRRSARDLLAYLALHPDGATRDQTITALWPDHTTDTATTLFNTAVGNARKTLRTATELREPMFIIRTTGRYRLDPHLIDIDLWNLTTTLTEARTTPNSVERVRVLERLIELSTGDFATDLTHHWAEAHREYLRRTTTDMLARLAHHLHDTHPDQALAALEHTIQLDPYAEPLYRILMQLQRDLGHPDAAYRTYQLLETRLVDIDTEPDDQTHQLVTWIRTRRA